ncbi:MAG: hypothetical protein A2X64_05995 [Ignavibacteria bacterium GWF2_33_9]|nr:MAG: hypothetical protein A2X64_05995 [Ignavibacteria bacterium GWF2_33_9]
MKDIQLCGIGNGLVDLQFKITDEQVLNYGMNKGEMRLIDLTERKKLNQYFSSVESIQCSGGSAANSIIAFSQLGGKSAYSTVLGNDNLGKFYANEFKDLGIILNAEFKDNYPTGTCFVFITPDSERTMLTSLEATAFFGKDNIDEKIIARSEWIYIEGYKLTQEASTEAIFKAIELAKKHHTKIAFTVSDVFIIDTFRANVNKIMEECDLVFCNENEAKSLSNTDNFNDASESLSKSLKNVVITKGAEGATIYWDGKRYDFNSLPTTPIDTTGAGDMYAGAFFYGILVRQDIEFAGKLASICASKIVSQFGARMNEDLKEFIKLV